MTKFKNLEAEKIRSGITNEDFAKKLNVTVNTIRRKLNGEISITVEEAKAIKTLFNNSAFTIDFLFAE